MSDDWDNWENPKPAATKPADDWGSSKVSDDWGSSKVSDDWGSAKPSNDGGWGSDQPSRPARGRGRGFGGRPSDNQSSFSNHRQNSESWGQPRQFEDASSGNGSSNTMRINSRDVGRVIGKGGSTIRSLQEQSGARISVDKSSGGNESTVTLGGSSEQQTKARELIENLINGGNFNSGSNYNSGGFQQRDSFSQSSEEFNPRKVMKTEPTPVVNTAQAPMPPPDEYDWDAAIVASDIATKAKWAALPPINKQFYFEDPYISNLLPSDVEQLRIESNNVMVSHFNEKDTRIIPNPIVEFEHGFQHYPEIMGEIQKNGFSKPSPIQAQSWPILLQGIDLIGIAQTGTGKTLAYLLPAMIHIDSQPTPRNQRVGPTALIMAPTRELAQQIEKESQKYCYRGIRSICIYGGGDRRTQAEKIGRGIEIVIATPGRLNDLCMARIIDLNSVSYLVLDEGRMKCYIFQYIMFNFSFSRSYVGHGFRTTDKENYAGY